MQRLFVFGLLSSALWIGVAGAQAPALPQGFFATPDPFTVSLRDARMVVGLMQRQRFLVRVAPDGGRSIVAARSARNTSRRAMTYRWGTVGATACC